jgi:predicted house-cleaning noncanonical NTP pyrophosphatase (MazG superfamily)
MIEIERDIVLWHRATFPNANAKAVIDKLESELREAICELKFGDMQKLLEELADVYIVACSLANRRDLFEDNVTMTRVIQDKMNVNKARTWGEEDENGDRPRCK